jgi:hypothetical protein
VEETVLEDPAGSATTPTSFRNHIVEAHPLKANSIKVRHLSLGDDVVSQEGRVSPATARYFLQQRQFSSSARLGKGDMEKQIKLLNGWVIYISLSNYFDLI